MPTAAPRPSPLLAAERLAERLGDPDLLVIDVRSAVDGSGREAYERGHIPGAVHSDYARDGWRATTGMATGMLPDDAALVAILGRIGLSPLHHAVIVSGGTSAGDFCGAARVYWTLKVVGHGEVAIVDGGMHAWCRDPRRPLETGAPPAPAAAPPYPVRQVPALRADLQAVEAAIERRTAVLLDSRAPGYFEGREKSPQVMRPGHLPGALQLYHADAFDPVAMTLKSRSALEQLFAPVPAGAVINYCNTGQQAATTWFVLSEILGRPEVSLYDGSLSEWAQDPTRPVVTGGGEGAAGKPR
jgi:thiosulfate/3-mercaptopyruvate sulfurtransferase